MEYCGRGSKIINMKELDINYVREQFPVFQNPKTSNFAFLLIKEFHSFELKGA